MNINCCAGLFVLFILFTKKVFTGEVPEEERAPEHVEDIPFRTHSLQNNTSTTPGVPVLPMSPYPYNFYYPNPYTLYSPLMYNYQSPPHLQSPQLSAEPFLQTTYPLNTVGYPIKVTQKFLNGGEIPQNMDMQVPSLMYTSFHNNRPSEIPSSDKSNLKQSLVLEPPSQMSFFQDESVSLANNTEAPAVNVNPISVQTHKRPSIASEKPSTAKIMHSTVLTIPGMSFESTTQPVNLSFEKETGSLVMDTATFDTITGSNNSDNIQQNQILPLNSSIVAETLSSEETRSEMKSTILHNFSNEAVTNTLVSDSFKNEIISSNQHSMADISGDKPKQTGASYSNTRTYLEKEIPTADNILEGKRNQNGPKRKSIEVFNGITNSESLKNANEQNNQLSDIREDIPNTIVVQISTIHNDRTIETPQVDPSRNIILFPMSSLMENPRNIHSIPVQHYQHQTPVSRSSGVKNNDSKRNSILEQNGQESISVTNEKNHQIGRRNKILNVTTLNSKEVQENATLQEFATENDSTKEQNKSLPVRTTNRNVIIRLPSGQELVIDLNHSRDAYKKSFSSPDSGEDPLGGALGEQPTQQTHFLENIQSGEIIQGSIRSEEENDLSRIENDIESTMPGAIQEWDVPDTPFVAPKYSSSEQNANLSTFNNLKSIDESSATASVQDYIKTAKDLENTDTKHADGNAAGSEIKYVPQRYSLPIPDDGQQNNKDSITHWSATPTKANTENMPTSPVRSSKIKIEIVKKPRSNTHSFASR